MDLKRFRLVFLLLFWVTCVVDHSANAAVAIKTVSDGSIRFEARNSTLEEIAEKLNDQLSLEIKGLENRKGETITFVYNAETPEDLLKGLLRHLGVKNYALEFADATLKRVVVVPQASNDSSLFSKSQNVPNQQKELVSVAQIQSIVEGSQAESAGLLKGDIILRYDGLTISSAQQLVKEVERKAGTSQVEVVVVRQKNSIRFILGGGFMGVRVLTQKIPRSDINAFQNVN